MLKFPGSTSPNSAPLPGSRLRSSDAIAAKTHKRWNEAAEIMLQLAVEHHNEFNESDCKLLAEAHREIIAPLMVAWNGARIRAADTSPDESSAGHREAQRLAKEIHSIADRLLTAASNQLSVARISECKALLWMSKGDALMWQLRISSVDRASAFQSLAAGAHLMAYDEACQKLSSASPIRLSAALRLAHFYAEKNQSLHKALEVSQRTIESAEKQINQLDQSDYKVSSQILDQLREAYQKWTRSVPATLCDTGNVSPCSPSSPPPLVRDLSNVSSSSASSSPSSAHLKQSKKELKKETKNLQTEKQLSKAKKKLLKEKQKLAEKAEKHRIEFENSNRVLILDQREEFHFKNSISTVGELCKFLESQPQFLGKKVIAFSSKSRKISSPDAEVQNVTHISFVSSVESPTVDPAGPLAFPHYPGVAFESVIARSGQAIVYRAKYKNELVAAKLFFADSVSTFSSSDYRTELESLLRLHHPNVLKLVTCFELPQPCVLTPFMPEGDLCSFLRKNGIPNLELAIQFAKGIAKGLEYIHSERLIHRDLKSPNIFLHKSFEPVIGDFGLAHRSIRTLTVAKNREGTLYWMAPELFAAGLINYSNKIDVYAYGIILWEIFTGQLPYQEIADVETHVRSGGRPKLPSPPSPPSSSSATTTSNQSHNELLFLFVKLMQACWDADPKMRPPMNEVLKSIASISSSASASSSSSLSNFSPWKLFHVK